MLRRDTLEQFAPMEEYASARRSQNHFAGTEAMALCDAGIFEIDEAGFRAGDDEAVVGDGITHGAKAVAIEFYADGNAVTKNHGCRAVPRFALARKGFERHAHVGREKRIVRVSRRNQ